MHEETKKKPSLETCSNSSAAPEPKLAAAGAKYSTEWVLMTPACLTGRMASTWPSRRRAISTSSVVHDSRS